MCRERSTLRSTRLRVCHDGVGYDDDGGRQRGGDRQPRDVGEDAKKHIRDVQRVAAGRFIRQQNLTMVVRRTIENSQTE